MAKILIDEVFRPIKQAKVLIDGIWRNLYKSRILINEEWHFFELAESRVVVQDFWSDSKWANAEEWGLVPVDFWVDAVWSGDHWSGIFKDRLQDIDDSLANDDIWAASFHKKSDGGRKTFVPIDPVDTWKDDDMWKDEDTWKVN